MENHEKLLEIIPNKFNNRLGLLCDVVAINKKNRILLKIVVDKTYAPVSYQGRFYKRSGNNTIEINGNNLSNFLLNKYGKTWDDISVEEFSVDEINLETVEKFKNLSRTQVPYIDNAKDIKALFEKLNLYNGEHFNRVAILLFAKNPQKYFIQSHSKIGKFLSDSEVLTSDIVEGNLFEQVEKIIEILKTKYLKSYISYKGLTRIETLEYPYEALREAVINALIHRNYNDTMALQIRVCENKIVLSNGALLSPEVPVEKLKENHISKPFNPVIANVFYKAGLVETWGKGTNNIVEECLKMGLPIPDYEYKFDTLQITFYKTAQKTTQKTTREKIIELLEENNKLTRNELSELLEISTEAIKQHLANLKAEGILKRASGRKLGYWKIIK